MALGLLLGVGPPATAQTFDLATTAAQLRDKALTDPTAYSLVESLTTEIGPRLAGSPNAERARDWGLAKLKSLGFQNVHAEAFPITAIVRGTESAEVTGPYRQQLAVIGLGGTVPTPKAGVEAEIALFHTYADLLAAPIGSLKGKIAVVTEAQPRSREGTGYGQLSPNRRRGPSEAAKRGAIAYLTRSLATNDARLPHTGALNYDPALPKIPAGAISVPDAVLLDNMVARGQPVRIRLNIQTTTRPGTAWNVVGDLPGDGSSQEVIVIGGHLDSWDPGTGAIDDGAGVAITTAAAKLAAGAPGRRRTIRVVMFGAEEMDFASDAWGKAHQADFAHVALTSESDNGADNIWALRLPPGGLDRAEFKALPDLLRPLKVDVLPDAATGSGDDTRSMTTAGVPAFAFRQDASRYFDIHHSADDTLDKIDKVQLNQNVAAWTTVLYLAASGLQDFRAPAR
ncbi:MAG: peptidase family protein [Caulobacteraceae bacterium]|nr:peptidase family protein [Caulobacteraceae bacterium]